jgi:hypothetical protein
VAPLERQASARRDVEEFHGGDHGALSIQKCPVLVDPLPDSVPSADDLGNFGATVTINFTASNVTIPSDQPAGGFAVGAVGGTSGRAAFTPLTVTAVPPPSRPTTAYFAEG